MSSVQFVSPSRHKRQVQVSMTDLVDQLRSAMQHVDELPEQEPADRDNDAMAKAMGPVNALFKKVKNATPKSISDVSLQLTIIADIATWFGNGGGTAIEDMSSGELQAIAKNLAALLDVDQPRGNPSLIIAPTRAQMDAKRGILAREILSRMEVPLRDSRRLAVAIEELYMRELADPLFEEEQSDISHVMLETLMQRLVELNDEMIENFDERAAYDD